VSRGEGRENILTVVGRDGESVARADVAVTDEDTERGGFGVDVGESDQPVNESGELMSVGLVEVGSKESRRRLRTSIVNCTDAYQVH
jgi:hypothetical protein